MKTPRLMSAALSSILLLFFISTIIFPGTTGKISGKITDGETGEPLIGASIVVEGTYLGAASDINGYYYINNIPPGKYNLLATSIGYHKQTVQNVIVKIDLTTKIDINLTSTSVTLSGEVVVRAERPLVQKDLTSSSATVSSDDIKMMPVEGVGQVIGLQAGVVGGHFRGGRSNEVAYLIDGVSVNDAFNNTFNVEIENTSVRQMEIISGTFNAEYGQAMSGIVNIVTQDGSQSYEGSVSSYAGNFFTNHSDIFQNLDKPDRVSQKNIQFNLSGPVPLLKGFTFFTTGRYYDDQGYLYGKRVYNVTDDVPITDPADNTKFFARNTGNGEYVSLNPYRKYSFNGKLTYSLPNFKFSYSLFWDDNKSRGYNHSMSWTPDGIKTDYRQNAVNTFQITHVISQSTFQTLQFSSNYSNYYGYLYADPYDPRYVNPTQGLPATGYTFNSGGNDGSRYDRYTITQLAKWTLNSQVSKEHKIGVGIEAKFHTIYNHSMSIINMTEGQTDSAGNVIFTLGYPQLGTTSDRGYNQSYKKYPWEFSGYIQDKVEYDIMIINAGIRVEYFQPSASYPLDLKNPRNNPIYPGSSSDGLLLQKASGKLQISPRLGVSFPISDKGAIHFSYGHFFQIPDLSNLYVNSDFVVNPVTSLSAVMGNPDLKGQRTVSYELGLQQMLFPNVVFDITAYYRDIRDLLGMEIIRTYEGFRYARYINQDYGNTRGFVVTLEKQFSDYFGVKMDYTYQIAEGNSSDPMQVFNNNQTSPPVATPKKVVPLDWDQRNTLNISLNVGEPGDWTAGLIFGYGAGMPYTEDARFVHGLILPNLGVRPSTYNVDLRADKNFKVAGVNLNVFFLVYNLLDIKNEYAVYGSTGRAMVDLNTKWAGQIVGLNTIEQFVNNPAMYSAPRQLRLGLNLGF
ncbi:MAG: TonB-dependent receptor [Ignavibacteria bacterium]